ncbi:hypothetical protein E2L06_15280 [Haloterrigena sp. H1]|uniref:hypothetical protein n=1 Tax=Haloterrigena sp. H1 TaxID=2552943 RepID=UPI00110DA9E2|nr:hypothetical protein E2L06_15280 [Haloterrigena sp. H1]
MTRHQWVGRFVVGFVRVYVLDAGVAGLLEPVGVDRIAAVAWRRIELDPPMLGEVDPRPSGASSPRTT